MNITEYFKPCNSIHIKAYLYLQEHGHWPKDFIPDDVTFDSIWHIQLISILADEYLKVYSHLLYYPDEKK